MMECHPSNRAPRYGVKLGDISMTLGLWYKWQECYQFFPVRSCWSPEFGIVLCGVMIERLVVLIGASIHCTTEGCW